jgi:hypothetical protein
VFPDVPDSLVAPVDNFNYSEEDYVSTELTNLRALINSDLENGGWGVTHVDEEELFSRQRERLRDESLVQEEELFDSFSARGFDIPQGDQIDQVRVLQKQTLDKLENVNLDISTSRADLIRKSRENVIAQTNTLTQTMTTYRGFMQQRLLGAAEFLAGHAINLFNAKVERHNLLVTTYNSYVGSYQTQVNAALTQVQVSKVALEAEALKSEINSNTIDLYQAQIVSVTSLIQMYQAELDAAKTVSDIERDKLLIFQSEIESYKTQVDAEVSKANLYATQLGAEEIKSRVFATNIDLYRAEIASSASTQQTLIGQANTRVRENALLLERYRANIARHRTEVEKGNNEIRSNISLHQAEGSIYGSYASAYASYIGCFVSVEAGVLFGSINAQEVASNNAKFNADSANTRAKLQSDAAEAAAEIYSGYASAYATINSNLDIDVI